MRALRLLAVLVAMLVAAPSVEAQVWKPKSRQKSPGAKRKPAQGPISKKVSKKKKAKAAAAKKQTPKKKPAKKKKATKRPPSDDDFTIIEEDFPDED